MIISLQLQLYYFGKFHHSGNFTITKHDARVDLVYNLFTLLPRRGYIFTVGSEETSTQQLHRQKSLYSGQHQTSTFFYKFLSLGPSCNWENKGELCWQPPSHRSTSTHFFSNLIFTHDEQETIFVSVQYQIPPRAIKYKISV